MDKEMIERCSDAVDRLPAFDFNNHEREQIVMAVAKAMREPTETQYNALCATNLTWRELNSHKVWTTYIDAITGAE